MDKKNMALRIAWIIPNVFLYLLFIGIGIFVIVNVSGLNEINRLGIWVIMLLLLLAVAVFGSIRIRIWMKQGKL